MVADAVAVDEEERVAAAGFVEGCLGASARQRDGALPAADGDGAQVAAEQGGDQAGFASSGDGRWRAVRFVSDCGLLGRVGAGPGGPGPATVGRSARTARSGRARSGWRWLPVCRQCREFGAVGGAAEEARIDVDLASSLGQQGRGPVGHGLHGGLVQLVRDLMPDVVQGAVSVETEVVEQARRRSETPVDVDRSVAVVDGAVDVVFIGEAHRRRAPAGRSVVGTAATAGNGGAGALWLRMAVAASV